MKKLVKQVINIGREVQILGPWYSTANCLRLVRTVIWLIAICYSCIITVYLPICREQAEKHQWQWLIMIIKHKFSYLQCADSENI